MKVLIKDETCIYLEKSFSSYMLTAILQDLLIENSKFRNPSCINSEYFDLIVNMLCYIEEDI
jgi:hypothetical protein